MSSTNACSIIASLKVELPMVQDPVVVSRLSTMWSIKYSGREAWDAFTAICGMSFVVTRVGSQLLMTFALIQKSPSGLLFLAMCSIKPLVSLFVGNSESIDGSACLLNSAHAIYSDFHSKVT